VKCLSEFFVTLWT